MLFRSPLRAKSCGKGALIGVIVEAALVLLIWGIVFIAGVASYILLT